MKRLCSFFVMASFVCSVFAGEVSIEPKMSDVTVYLNGASIVSSAETKIPAGVSYVTLKNLPSTVRENSIQVAGIGNFTIMNVTYKMENETTPKADSLLKLKNKLQDSQSELLYTKDVYQQEIELLKANKEIKGANANLNTTELEKMLVFYQKQLLDLNVKIHTVSKSLEETKAELTRVENELKIYRNAQQKGAVVVAVSAAKEQKIALGLSYYVPNASWMPFYEVRVTDVNKDLDVVYKAKIYQSTGYDWDNVNVTLSTGNPTLNGTVPTLEKWVLREQRFYPLRSRPISMNKKMTYTQAAADVVGMEDAEMESMAMAAGISTTTSSKLTSVEFAINEKFSVKSTQDDATLTIKKHTMPASYVYRCVPKLDKHAYLLAKITDFSQYNFLSGEASLYLEGKYVGRSQLHIAQTTDTLEFSLGQDAGIVVNRTLANDFSKKSSAGKNYKQTVAWTISARNNKQSAVSLEIKDNIPISGSSSIEVSNISHAGASLDADNIVTWKFDLQPSEAKTMNLSYMVTYPKTMSLDLK